MSFPLPANKSEESFRFPEHAERVEMRLREDFFALFCSGEKTIEIRVNDVKRRRIRPGQSILFRCGVETLHMRVERIAVYATFDEMLDNEPLSLIHPYQDRSQQLTFLRQLYPPEKESLGVLAMRLNALA
jgi:ASC-1-like (ASCH) protein